MLERLDPSDSRLLQTAAGTSVAPASNKAVGRFRPSKARVSAGARSPASRSCRGECGAPEAACGAVLSIALLVALSATPQTSHAHPEYQRDLVQRTGRAVNCAYCHTSADGPEGTGLGQIGRLTPSELEQLGRARAALEPGAGVESPILNRFGNQVLNVAGKARVLELRLAPGELINLLPVASDLDSDGIDDVQEFRDGTHPLIDSDGDPRRLFWHNLRHSATQLILALAATFLGLWGLKHLLRGFDLIARRPEETETMEERGV